MFLQIFLSDPPFQARSNGLQHAVGDKLVVVHPFYYYVIDDEVSAWNL